MKTYKHLSTQQNFPDVSGVNVYQYDNALDYQRYDYDQMDVLLTCVPWDMGEVHVGQRVIEGLGNVVQFKDAAARDAWLTKRTPRWEWQTKFKELHRDYELDVPLPFDVAAKFNYVAVRYHLFANDDSMLQYESTDGLRKWFYFIREVEFVAPNTTRLHLADDAWQTFIYDVNVSGMLLERGHAPLFASDVDTYLANPVENNAYLLTEDASFGDLSRVADQTVMVLNGGDTWACFSCTGAVGNWGTMYQNVGWQTPAYTALNQDGVPSYFTFAIDVSDLTNFLAAADSQAPQFKQTVQGVFFIDKGLVNTIGGEISLFGYTAHWLEGRTDQYLTVLQLQKSMWGYDDTYADLAKLYTYPYSAIEVTDDSGATELIKIEDTSGTLQLHTAVSLAFPFINISGVLTGVGTSRTQTITFQNASAHQFTFGGRWYDHLREWDVPVFNVIQQNSTYYDFDTYFDRVQAKNDYETARSNALADAATAFQVAEQDAATQQADAKALASAQQENTKELAKANKDNADENANTITDNAAAQAAANTAINDTSNQYALTDVNWTNALQTTTTSYENNYTTENANASATAETQNATLSAASGFATSAVSSAVAGASAGPAGSIAGAVGGLISGAISSASTIAQGAVAANLTTTQAANAVNLNNSKVNAATNNSTQRTSNQVRANTANKDSTNTAITTTAANQAATIKLNATRTKNAMDENADRTYDAQTGNADRDYTNVVGGGNVTGTATLQYNTANANANRTAQNAQNRIDNQVRQAALGAPQVFGSVSNAQTATTRPIALFADVVTQSRDNIASAGDEFLRWGYRLDKQWRFDGDWTQGHRFCYWKLRDVWMANINLPDKYMDRIRFFLLGGVTVWANPDDIGNCTIYENTEVDNG